MTRIVVTRTGGFAGIVRSTEVTDAKDVERLLTALRAGVASDAPPRADGFVFDFAVEGAEGAAPEQYSVPESTLPSGIRDLLP